MLPLWLLTFWPGFADAAAVEGLRPAHEVRAALHALSFGSCAHGDADIVVDVEILAAGFVDRTSILANTNFDEACVVDTVRTLALSDRGKEPATHVVLELASTAPPALPPRAVSAALAPVRDDFARCAARAHAAGIAVLHFTANDDGSVSDVDVKLTNEAARACIAARLAKLHVDHAGRVSYAIPFDAQPIVETKHESATLLDALGCGNAFR